MCQLWAERQPESKPMEQNLLKRSWIPRQGSNRKRSAGENKMTVNGEGENGENSFPTMKKEKIK
ncbi:hypothetical protein F9C07_8826 [Aspergillus flavus]|uniref:Uncharacterized protein n=1 Tax=Aspergillus flavus (strain ATCC 200026 / FGSC A1120 / IAM 13836 / NRRL 3357 / JCM 12722 / SRRC 167) TaxID=332952 RepID=A0A7U2MIZ9_ASPFN|nr:hypothetical protein F9C07_8826 [Aspergillus flavus]